MTPDKAHILQKIKQHIDISYDNDFSPYWTNKLKHLEPIKNTNPSNSLSKYQTLKRYRPTQLWNIPKSKQQHNH